MTESESEVQSDLPAGLLHMGEPRRAFMTGASRHDNAQS